MNLPGLSNASSCSHTTWYGLHSRKPLGLAPGATCHAAALACVHGYEALCLSCWALSLSAAPLLWLQVNLSTTCCTRPPATGRQGDTYQPGSWTAATPTAAAAHATPWSLTAPTSGAPWTGCPALASSPLHSASRPSPGTRSTMARPPPSTSSPSDAPLLTVCSA